MKRILLVDDEAHVLRVIKLNLERNGFAVETALSGEIALSLLKNYTDDAGVSSNFDIVIADVDMPVMSGCELAQYIHRDFGTESPVVFLLGEDSHSDLPEILKSAQQTEFVEKPMSLRWLVSRINDYFGQFEGSIVPG